MRAMALVCVAVLLCPARAAQQEPTPIVLTFDKLPEDGRCGAADHITAGIRLEDAGAQIRLTVEPWVIKGDHMAMRMLLAGCGWQAAEKGNPDQAALRWGAGFVLAAMDDALDSKRLADSHNTALAAYRADEKYIQSANQYIWMLEDAAQVPHVLAADPGIAQACCAGGVPKPERTKKTVFFQALGAALGGAARGYVQYQRELASRRPVYCTGQQMGSFLTVSCQ